MQKYIVEFGRKSSELVEEARKIQLEKGEFSEILGKMENLLKDAKDDLDADIKCRMEACRLQVHKAINNPKSRLHAALRVSGGGGGRGLLAKVGRKVVDLAVAPREDGDMARRRLHSSGSYVLARSTPGEQSIRDIVELRREFGLETFSSNVSRRRDSSLSPELDALRKELESNQSKPDSPAVKVRLEGSLSGLGLDGKDSSNVEI